MKLLRRNSKGEEVRDLQRRLKALGYYQAYAVDGSFGPGTEDAVEEFQEGVARLAVDGIVGPNTWGALEGALVETPEDPVENPEPSALSCDDDTWSAWLDLVKLITTTPVQYGPGRGAFSGFDGAWLVRDKSGNYPRGSNLGYHAFVCSTWTNFMCAYLLRYNELFTPAGGIPSWVKVCESDSSLHPVPGLAGAFYRGYGEYMEKVAPNIKDLPLGTLYNLRDKLPTFVVAAQASRKRAWWNYHHCVGFVIDHRQAGSPMYRIAADGYRGRNGFSRTPMVYKKIDQAYIDKHDARHRLRAYAITGLDKMDDQPIYPVGLE